MEGISSVLGDARNAGVLRKFSLFSVLMIVLPISVFFGAKHLAVQRQISLGFLGIDNANAGTVLAALIAVGVTNVLMIAFVFSALAEDAASQAETTSRAPAATVAPSRSVPAPGPASVPGVPKSAKDE
ncbi:hypothetical protein FVE85_6842 [Porphyridium purpureum]|uniref:Vacuolar ATPase assembly integral membrane protein VMA21 n=1 Tax=Porphyridium purpureum TaxID=35688 RepID=A0A5J4Z9C8_PORPP|nr:hypothetical protein FVE85_6842 [Porphyridium purpureum]|eukprot:POR1568..scf295_1